jgi:hypothetical protein
MHMMNGGPENIADPDPRTGDETDNPAGEMRLTRRDRIGVRISVLAGMGVIAIGTVATMTSPTLVSYQGGG